MDRVMGELIGYLIMTEQASRHNLRISSPPLLYTNQTCMYRNQRKITHSSHLYQQKNDTTGTYNVSFTDTSIKKKQDATPSSNLCLGIDRC